MRPTVADKAIWIIERNLEDSLSLPAIAQACGVSRSHLAYAFGSATGQSVMKYLRARRLSRAAEALASGAPDILSVAFDAGYGSHEAFTRAFREAFSITPERLRDRKSLDGLRRTNPLVLQPRKAPDLPALRLKHQEALQIVGLAIPCSFETTNAIPAQWQRFMTHYAGIPHKTQSIPIGVNQLPDEEGRFEYLCGAEVTHFDETPAGLEQLEILARDYAVFEHSEHVSTLYATYAVLWNDVLPTMAYTVADAPVLERHNPTFDPRTGEGGLTLWIPLA